MSCCGGAREEWCMGKREGKKNARIIPALLCCCCRHSSCILLYHPAQIHTVEHEAENNREAQGCQGE